MKILLAGEFDNEDLKQIAAVIRSIEQKHGGDYHMLVDDPASDADIEEIKRHLLDIWPEAPGIPFDVVAIKKEKP